MPSRGGELGRARRLAWLNIAYLCSSVTLLSVVMAGSQALKTEFVGDLFSLIPPALFPIGDRPQRAMATVTRLTAARSLPLIVTALPPASGPDAGLSPETVGAAT